MCGTAWNPVIITDEMVSETLNDAADLLEEGWCRGRGVAPHPNVIASFEPTYTINIYLHGGVDRCVSQAIAEASVLKIDGPLRFPGRQLHGSKVEELFSHCTEAFLEEAGYFSKDSLLHNRIMNVPHWNDHIAKSAQHVRDTMRAAAKSVLK